ncbi:MAG: hypothetical protein J5685_08490, partial [Clostridiales bacterium]|nr:hypothetical protein [Clostridiales bacterium]
MIRTSKFKKFIASLTVAVMSFTILPQGFKCDIVRADVTEYPLWVGNTHVTSENMGDIPGVQGGSMSYDPDTNTLTMENVTGVDTPYYWNGCYTLIYGNMDLTINLIGNNSWQRSTSSGNGSTGIELLDNDLTITGDGTLSFDLYSDRWSVYSISCIKLTMNGGTLIGRSQRGINGGVAFDIYDLEMNGGSIIASAGYQAIAYVIRDGDLVFSEDYGPLIEASYKMDGSDSSVITTNEMLAVGYANWSDYQNNPAYKYIKISNDQTLYNVTASDDGHGTCTASPDSAMIGSTVTVDATPDEGYRFVEWTVISGGVTLEEPSDSTTTFELRNSDAEVCAAFEV